MVKDTCWRLIGKEGEECQTCGRRIIRHNLSRGDYALAHEGPSIGQKLRLLNARRETEEA